MRRRRVWIVAVVGLTALGLAWDLSREPAEQWTAAVLLAGIDAYQSALAPRTQVRCRFEPTCSRYAEAAIRRYGALTGTWRAVGRIARCGPWTPAGTIDPP